MQDSIDDLIFETDFWKVVLNKNQRYLGRSVAVLLRPCPTLSQVTDQEMLDLLDIVKRYEKGLTKAFKATMFNWSCLMNLAYKEPLPNPHVHWHALPRYQGVREFAGKIWTDEEFGGPALLGAKYERKLESSIIYAIRDELRKHLR